jgi:hypothetical protein
MLKPINEFFDLELAHELGIHRLRFYSDDSGITFRAFKLQPSEVIELKKIATISGLYKFLNKFFSESDIKSLWFEIWTIHHNLEVQAQNVREFKAATSDDKIVISRLTGMHNYNYTMRTYKSDAH